MSEQKNGTQSTSRKSYSSSASTSHASSSVRDSRSSRIPWGSRSVEIFEKIDQIGEGTYGKVYMAKNKETNETVALKKIRMANEKEGFPITAIREIKILKELHHENIVQLKEIVTSSKSAKEKKNSSGIPGIYMVFEYMDHDLTGLMINEGTRWRPTEAQVKCYMKQLLDGLHYCHSKGVLHRDIKGSNLLISNQGKLKLADFGLARGFTEQPANYTNRVITLWYRPPELLLGAVQYGPAIDMWSVGCIMAELLGGRAIFPGRNEVDQLELIFKLCGTPDEQVWPGFTKLPWYHLMNKNQRVYKRCLRETFPAFSPQALELLERMLALDPSKRITAMEALDSEYFWTEPLPCEPSQLPTYPTSHEFQAKKRRNQPQAEATKRQKGPHGAPVNNPNPMPSNNYRGPPQHGPKSFTNERPPSGPPRGYEHNPRGQPPYSGGQPHSRAPPSSSTRPPAPSTRPPHSRPPSGPPHLANGGSVNKPTEPATVRP